MTEGTYPHGFGGVSVWCDQLIRGLSDHEFHLVALAATGSEPVAWELPDNVRSVVTVPLWSSRPVRRKPGRPAARLFVPLLEELLEVLLVPSRQAPQRFGVVLRELFEYARREDLRAAFRAEDAVRVLTDAWRTTWPAAVKNPPSLYDALTALQLLECSLSPLSAEPVRVDLSHCVANGLAVLPALAAKWEHGTPLLLTEHGIYLRERYLGFRDGPYRWPVKALHLSFLRSLCSLAYREADMIAPGNVYNRRWEERLGADPTIIRTVYNGVDPAEFPAVESEPGVPTVSWAGRVDPIKDLETLIRAFALIHSEIPRSLLRIFGGATKGREDYLDHCRQLAGDLGIGAAVSFEGRVAEIRDAYAAGHVVVLCSISEGFPYTVIEAMTSGRVCVATDVGGVAEAVAETGVVVPPRDPRAIADAVVELLRDDDRRRRLGTEARARALQYFTVDRAIGIFDEIYCSLGAGRPLLATYPDERDSGPETLEMALGVRAR
ncbi:lipopolysaccharide glycosyltransferase, putative [Planosporangium mesophilum]|uniref:Lipopolysaccharide glycosyltransferase, putative n=2 Tax=Planosporangium mesophilum TaxID=689768 RepID=A0A8J3X267_9ACTN|nr:lipopolysaccharide glycosyltransferase, putative [Planosporangium mesophilum]